MIRYQRSADDRSPKNAAAPFRAVRGQLVTLLAFGLALGAVTGLRAQGDTPEIDRDAAFENLMTTHRLDGQFTVVGPDGTSMPQEDLYMVSRLERGEGDVWIFRAEMSYRDGAANEIPIPVRVLWVGDSPMLVMDDQTIEGIGTFTVRLLIQDGLYAGTWSNGPVGGHMWGRLVPQEEGAEADAPGDGG